MRQFLIKSGFFEELKPGVRQPGLDLSRTILDLLTLKGLVQSPNCCDYTVGKKPKTVTATTILGYDSDVILVDNAGTAATITLPSPAKVTGMRITVARARSTSTGAITIATATGQITDVTTGVLGSTTTLGAVTTFNGRATFISNGVNWYYIA